MNEKQMPARPFRPARVAVVGSVNMDLVAQAARLPAPGETLMGEGFAGTPGGKGGNQAVAAARLGAEVSLIARVGLRQHGEELLQSLQREGVALDAVVRDPQAWPGVAVIMVAREGGENAIVVAPGSNAQLSPADVEAAQATLGRAQVLVAQLEVPLPAVLRAFELARQAGVTTVLNAAPAQALPSALLALTDWLVVNETEAAQLSGVPAQGDALALAAQAAPRLLASGVRQLLVTLGAQGAWLQGQSHPQGLHVVAPCVQAVDTVGAGDTLVGGLAVGLAEGQSPEQAVALGQRAAALAVARPGVQQAMPRRAELGPAFAAPAAGPDLPAAAVQSRHKVIFDTDPGIDDALALWLLARHPAIDLRAITTVHGNASVDITTANARGLASLFGLDIPVARGAQGPLLESRRRNGAAHVHGEDGLGGLAEQLPAPERALDERPAHVLLCELIHAHPGEIELVAVGPLTNLALALRHDPSIVTQVRQVVVMGGAFGTHGHSGNVTPVAEANIIADPEAADAVFAAAWPVVIVGLDVTQEAVMTESRLAVLRDRGGAAGELLWASSRAYQRFYQARDGIPGIYAHDASAAAFVITPQAFRLRAGPVRVALDGLACGQTIQDWRGESAASQPVWRETPSQQVCVGVDARRVLDLFDDCF